MLLKLRLWRSISENTDMAILSLFLSHLYSIGVPVTCDTWIKCFILNDSIILKPGKKRRNATLALEIALIIVPHVSIATPGPIAPSNW